MRIILYTGAVLFQQSCPKSDSVCQLFGETGFHFKQISYIIRKVYNKSSLQFFLHNIFNLFWSSLCIYTL